MARISQYKALGTKMGGYKSTLSKVQSMEYAKKHEDFKAGEKKALYSEIGGTVANILGIVDEHRRLKELEPLPTPDRPEVKLGQQEAEMVGDVGMDEEAGLGRFQDFDTSAPIPGLESSYMQGMKGEVELPNIPSPPERIDVTGARTAARGATESMRLSPDTTAGALPMTGIQFAERGGARGTQDTSQQGYPMWGEDSVGAGDATYPTEAEVEMYQPADPGREFAGAFDNLDALKDMNPLPLEKPGYPTAEEVEKYQPAPITDNMAFDAIKDPVLGDEFSPINKYYGTLSGKQKQNLDIAKSVGGGYAQKVMMRESSAGVNTGDTSRAGSVFQYKRGGTYLGDKKIPEGVIGDIQKETQYFMEYNKQQTKGFDKSEKNTFGGVQMTYQGKPSSVYEIASKAAGMGQESVNYLTHQQGRAGFKDILNSVEKGSLRGGEVRFDKMIGNITPEFSRELSKEFGSLTYENLKDKATMKKFAKRWLEHQQSEWHKMEGDFY